MSRDLRLRVLFEALDKVTQPLREIAGGSSAASKALKETQSKLQALNRAQGDVSAFRKLKQEAGGTEQALKQAQTRVAALARELQATDAPTKKLKTEFERAKRAAASLKTEHQAQSRQLQQQRERLSAAGIPTSQLAEHERRLRQEVSRANTELEAQSRRLDAVATRSKRLAAGREAFGKVQGVAGQTALAGAASLGGGMALAAPLTGATQQAMTFESAMADVRKVVDFPTPAAFKDMQRDVLNLSTQIPMAAEGLAQIVAAAGRAGIAREELLGFATDAAKMGIAFDTTAEDAGEMMAKWRTAFGLGQKEVVGLADQINALTNTYGGNVQAVTDMVTRIGPLGKVAGVTAPQIASIAQLMNKVGVEAEVGATGIKNMMLRLTQGAAATKSQQEAFKALGLNAEAVSKSMQKDASGTILNVMERISGLSADRQSSILTQLFGSESVGAIAPLLTNLDQLKANLALVGDASQYAGSMEQEYLTRIATTEGAVGLARNAFNALNIELGTRLLPTVVDFAKRGGDLLNRLRAWAGENPRLVKGMLWAAGILSGLMLGFGGLALAITALLAPFAALAFIAGVFNVAMLPLVGIVLAVIVAIGALVAAGLYLYNNWDAIAAWWSELWDGIALTVSNALTSLSGMWQSFKEFGANLIAGVITGITGKLTALKNTVLGAATSVRDWFKTALGIRSPSRVFMGLGGDVMAGLDQGLSNGADSPLNRIRDLSGQLTRAMAVGVTAPALLAASPAGAAAPTQPPQGAATAAVNGATFNFYITGSNAQDIAREVRRTIEQMNRESAGRTFGDR